MWPANRRRMIQQLDRESGRGLDLLEGASVEDRLIVLVDVVVKRNINVETLKELHKLVCCALEGAGVEHRLIVLVDGLPKARVAAQVLQVGVLPHHLQRNIRIRILVSSSYLYT